MEAKQKSFFPDWNAAERTPPPIDPSVPRCDEARLTGQNRRILHMLRERPHTNDELSKVARKYTSRISDLRAAGFRIDCRRVRDGLTLYRLE